MCIITDFNFSVLRPKKIWSVFMAAILNFSKTLKKSLAHLHIVGNVIVISDFKFWSFCAHKKIWGGPLAAILNFGSISIKSLAHPYVGRNVMLKFQKKLTSTFWVFAPTRKRDAGQNPGATKIPLPLRAGHKKADVDGADRFRLFKIHQGTICWW